jgi:GH15 family glucan-1,4-alpha-glucosidase
MTEGEGRYPPISSYGLIGDGRCAALVSRSGSIDWLCLPRFDSASVFAAILDAERGGRFQVKPTTPFSVERRYVGATNVLETTFHTATGELRLTDAMMTPTQPERRREMLPDHELLRRVECSAGEVELDVVFDPRPDYGGTTPRIRHQRAVGWLCPVNDLILALQTEVPLRAEGGAGLRGRTTLRAGEQRYLSLTAEQGPAVVAGLGEAAERRLQATLTWWQRWSLNCVYDGDYQEAVLRSVLTLRQLIYCPSGAIVAAPTTSLPESIGAGRNWDYRYCWLRDSAMTLRAMFDQGITDEGEEFLGWMLQATRLTWPELQVLYTVHGDTHTQERVLPQLEGYRGSRPVRIGNAARDQLQLDIYGEVIAAAVDYVDRGGTLDPAEARMLQGLGSTVLRRWREPDNGIWELRSGRRHHTLSKALCCVGLEGLLTLHERGILSVPAERYRREAAAIRAAVEEHSWNADMGCYAATLDGDDVDASVLLLALYGYADAGSERMRRTVERIHAELSVDGLLYRYRVADGLQGQEGAFGICSFWAVDVMARQGRLDEAVHTFEHLLSRANDLGLFAEELVPGNREMLGNFPQAFTHVGLINAADTIHRVRTDKRPAEIRGGTKRRRGQRS